MPPPKPNPQDRGDEARAWVKYTGLAVQLIGMIGVCVFIGLWADRSLNTSPILTVIMSLVGVVGGLYVSLKDLL